MSQTTQSLRKRPGSSPAPSGPEVQASRVVSCACPATWALPSPVPAPSVAPRPEPWPPSSTLGPGRWPQWPALGCDQRCSPPLPHLKPGSQMGPNPSVTEPLPDRAADRAVEVGVPHKGRCGSTPKATDTLCTCTNPEALDTPQCKEAEPQQLRDGQTLAHGRRPEGPPRGSGRDPETHRETHRGTHTKGKPEAQRYTDVQTRNTPKVTHTVAPGSLEELQLQLQGSQSVRCHRVTRRPWHPATTLPSKEPDPGHRAAAPSPCAATHPWFGCSEGIPSAGSVPPAQPEPGAWGPQGPLRSS